jgi:hypothetical protein
MGMTGMRVTKKPFTPIPLPKGERMTFPSPFGGLACLTAHEPGSTVPLDEKGRLKSLFPPHSTVCLVSTEKRTSLDARP